MLVAMSHSLARVECRRQGTMMPRLHIGSHVDGPAIHRQSVGHSKVAHLHQRPLRRPDCNRLSSIERPLRPLGEVCNGSASAGRARDFTPGKLTPKFLQPRLHPRRCCSQGRSAHGSGSDHRPWPSRLRDAQH